MDPIVTALIGLIIFALFVGIICYVIVLVLGFFFTPVNGNLSKAVYVIGGLVVLGYVVSKILPVLGISI